MKEIDLIIFDFDGTLIDSTEDIANAVNFTLNKLDEPQLSRKVIESNVGDGVLKLLKRCLIENHQRSIEEAVHIFRRYYGEHLVVHTVLYSGAEEVLKHFSGKKKAILTNKPERFVAPILEGLGMKEHFDYVIGGDGKTVPKPSKEAVDEILEHFEIREERAVMVGDSPVDIETGKLAEILTCAFTGGYRSREELEAAGPDYMIDRLEQLKELFC